MKKSASPEPLSPSNKRKRQIGVGWRKCEVVARFSDEHIRRFPVIRSQVRVVFGCNHISHRERNANNSASRYRNRLRYPGDKNIASDQAVISS